MDKENMRKNNKVVLIYSCRVAEANSLTLLLALIAVNFKPLLRNSNFLLGKVS